MTTPITEQRLEDLAGKLKAIPMDSCGCETCIRIEAALDLAIRIAEKIGRNPRGFLNWVKVTSGGEL